jgi:TonB family protein
MHRFISILILFFGISFHFSAFSFRRNEEVHLVFHSKDAYTTQRVGGIMISIYTTKGDFVYSNTMAEIGQLDIKIELDLSEHEVRVNDPDSVYMSYSFSLYLNKKSKSQHLQIDLYPSQKTLSEWIKQEDKLYGDSKSGSLSNELNDEKTICGCAVEDLQEASFGSESKSLFGYISKSVNYPQQSIENGEQGRVYVKFIVETDGSVSHILVERGVSQLLDAETIRVIRQMPKWNPGSCEGKAVRMFMRMPVSFTLN